MSAVNAVTSGYLRNNHRLNTPARAGIVIRAAYLQRIHSMALPTYAALTAIILLGTVITASLMGLTGYAITVGGSHPVSPGLAVVFVGSAAASISMLWMSARLASVGIAPELGLVAAMLDRAVSFTITMVLGTSFGRPLLKRAGTKK